MFNVSGKRSFLIICTLAIFALIFKQASREARWLQNLSVNDDGDLPAIRHNRTSHTSVIQPQATGSTDKPTFVMYVGLPKTATSFLQCTLCGNWETTKSTLQRDNYVYIGTCPLCGKEKPSEALIHRFQAFFDKGNLAREGSAGPVLHTRQDKRKRGRTKPVKISRMLRSRVEKALALDRNAFLIYEGAHRFPDDHIKELADYLRPKWNVKIVVGYRPLYEWLPSKYNSVTKTHKAGAWPGEISSNGKAVKEILPFDLDNRTQDGFSRMVREIEVEYNMHPTEIVRNNYALYFDNVYVMDSTQTPAAKGDGDPLLEHFFCNVIPHAPETCQAIRQGTWKFQVAGNPSVSLSDDILAVAAYRAGLINNGKPVRGHRRVTRDGIRGYLHKLPPDYELPLKCWSQAKLDRLEKLSLRLERQLFVESWTPQRDEAHRQGFAKTVGKKKFCDVDPDATLKQRRWKAFFDSDLKRILKRHDKANAAADEADQDEG